MTNQSARACGDAAAAYLVLADVAPDPTTTLPTWAALRRHATDLRRTIRANRCTYSCPEDINSEGRVEAPAVARCPKENPDAPGEWCDNCNRRATARAELAAVKKDIRATERKMLWALNNEVSNG